MKCLFVQLNLLSRLWEDIISGWENEQVDHTLENTETPWITRRCLADYRGQSKLAAFQLWREKRVHVKIKLSAYTRGVLTIWGRAGMSLNFILKHTYMIVYDMIALDGSKMK